MPTSKTHISNITAPTFFHPLTSKQQRDDASRAMSPPPQEIPQGRSSQDTNRTSLHHRSSFSNASIVTMDQTHRIPVDDDVPPLPASRGEIDERFPPDMPFNLGSLRSQGSNVPLRSNDSAPSTTNARGLRAARSTKSDGRSFGWSSQTSKDLKDTGHEKLGSAPTSPQYGVEKSTARSDLGRNYEYYNGNFIFFFQGRLLNTRQKPLSAITAFLSILPAALFFAFS